VGGSLLAAVGLWASLAGQEPVEPVTARKVPTRLVDPMAQFLGNSGKEEPWLGVLVSKPAKATYAQLPKVPKGTGFVVDDVSSNGPAMLAGVKEFDFLWKLNDQLLINEAQFLALLELQKVGNTVRLTIFRGGENIELEAVLQDRPESEKGRELADQQVLSPPIPGMPSKVVNVHYRTAELHGAHETVRISRQGDVYTWAVFDDFGLEMESGRIPVGEDIEIPVNLDKSLQGKLKALIRSFEEAERRQVRRPRVRRVPTPNPGKSQ
jgi:hypothetical protein